MRDFLRSLVRKSLGLALESGDFCLRLSQSVSNQVAFGLKGLESLAGCLRLRLGERDGVVKLSATGAEPTTSAGGPERSSAAPASSPGFGDGGTSWRRLGSSSIGDGPGLLVGVLQVRGLRRARERSGTSGSGSGSVSGSTRSTSGITRGPRLGWWRYDPGWPSLDDRRSWFRHLVVVDVDQRQRPVRSCGTDSHDGHFADREEAAQVIVLVRGDRFAAHRDLQIGEELEAGGVGVNLGHDRQHRLPQRS